MHSKSIKKKRLIYQFWPYNVTGTKQSNDNMYHKLTMDNFN